MAGAVAVAGAVGSVQHAGEAETTVISHAGEAKTTVMPRTSKTAVMQPVAKTAVMRPADETAALLPAGDATAPRERGSRSSGRGKHPQRGRTRSEATPVTQRRAVWPWMLLAVLLVAAGLGVASSMGLIGPSRNTPVPGVTSKSRANAQTALKTAGFAVGSVTETFSASAKSGMVISQSPKRSAKAPLGSAVDLLISRGPEMVSVPNVVGMPEADAFKALQQAGFSPQALPSEFSNDVPENTVFAQKPKGDEKAVKYSVVNYVVSRGPEPFVPGANDRWGRSGKSKGGGGD